MANIMALKSIMNKPSRNGFDLSSKRNFTAKAGELLPVWHSEVLPGDSFTIDLKAFTRTAPVNTAAFARIREYYDFYYVPYHLLWNRANEVLSQMDFNQQHATSLNAMPDPFSGELPYVSTSQIGTYLQKLNNAAGTLKVNYFGYNRAQLSVKLLEYLGYGNFEGYLAQKPTELPYNLDMNIMGLLAYQKIYSDYYRNQQWEKPNPSTFNADYMNGSSTMNVAIPSLSSDPFFADYNLFDLRYCDWPKDLYHGVLPQPQYGDTTVVPLNLFADGIFRLRNTLAESGTISIHSVAIPSYANGATKGNSPLSVSNGSTSFPDSHLSYGAGLNGNLSILALRQAEFLQKWREISQCGDQDYKGITKRIWGVDVPNGLADKCQYLGGCASSLDINEVVNNNITGDNGASIAGKGIGVSDGKITFNADGQYGVVMCIYHCMPLVDYTVDYVSPAYTRVNAEDFANPVFDRVGMQPVSSSHVFNSTQLTNIPNFSTPFNFGYAPRYIDYKTAIDLSIGAFKRSLKNWVLSYDAQDMYANLVFGSAAAPDSSGQPPTDNPPETILGSNVVVPNYTFFKVNPNLVDPIFAVAADSSVDTDEFWCSSFFDVKVVRNLDTDGLPY